MCSIGALPHFVCITLRQGPTLPKWLDMSIRAPIFLHYRTHRLHVDQIHQNMGTSPNSSSLCHTNRVNAGQPFFELTTPFLNSLTNRVSGTMSKAAELGFGTFPRFMLKRRTWCPNSTILLLFSPIFRNCAQLHDKAGSLYGDLCKKKKKKNCCLLHIQLMMK